VRFEEIEMPGTFEDYQHADALCQAYVAGGGGRPKPCVMIGHTWAGQSEAEQATADKLAELGYVAIAIDVYGKGRRGEHGTPTAMATNTALMQPFMQDRTLLRDRLRAAVEFAKARDDVDASRIAVVGYCFGGLCALDVARSGADVRGAVSIHGIFAPPAIGEQGGIEASILILHGWDDPMAPPEDVVALAKELTDAKADWELDAYGHAMHAFTNRDANMPERGVLYNAKADARSWRATTAFLSQIFA
jgi:dienelactone hydrolase